MEKELEPSVQVPLDLLTEEAIEGLISEFVLREGTDYGVREFSLEEKMQHIRSQLDAGHAVVAFDPNVESCSIIKKEELKKL